MAWSHLQSVSKAATGTSSSSQSVTFTTANLTSGSKMICAIGWASGSAQTVTVSSVKDGAGNAFTRMAGAPNAGGPSGCDLWQLDTPSGDAGTKPTITAQFSGSVQASMLVQEVSGLATGTTTAAVLDGTAGTKTGAGGSSTGSPTYSSSVSNEYLVTVYGDDGGPETLGTPSPPGTKDTATVSANSDADVGIGYGNSTGTTEAGSWPLSGSSAEWGVILVAFQLAAGGGTTNGTASLTAAGSLTAAAIETIEAAASLTAASSLAGAALDETLAAAALTAAGSLTAAGTEATAGAASLTAASSLTAAGISETLAAASLTAAGSLTAGGVETIRAAAALTAAGSLTAAAIETIEAAAALTAASSMSAAAGLTTQGAAALVAASSLVASGTYAGPPFPQSPLDAMTELDLDGTWTDISSYVYQRDNITITRGKQDESTTTQPSTLTQTWNNRDGRFSSKNPLGAYYGTFGRNTPVRVSVPDQSTYLRLEDDAVSYISCPASSGIEIAGDFDVRLDVKLTSWQKCTLAARYDGGTTAWWWGLNDDATLGFWYFDSGGTARETTSTSPVPYSGRFALRVTVAASTGTVTFYTAPDISGSWTQLGQPVTTGGTSVRGGTAPIEVGYSAAFATLGFGGLQGRVYAFQLYSGIGGTLKAGPDFTTATAGASTYTDAQSNVWTPQGTGEFSDRIYRGHFELSATPQAWDPTGSDVYCSIQGSGLLRRLQQNTQTLGSVFYRAFTQVDPPDDLIGYWSCEDGNALASGAVPANPTQWASAIPGVAAGTFTGGPPGFASNTDFLCSQSLPTISGSRWHFRLPSRSATDSANVFRFLCSVPAAGDTDGGTLARMFTTGTVDQVDLVYNSATGGTLRLVGYNWTASGTPIFDTGLLAAGMNGNPVWVSIELQTSGSDVQYSVTQLQPGASSGLTFSGTVTGTIGNATELVINALNFIGGENMSGSAVGQITYQGTWESLFDFGSQLDAYQGEVAGQRFARLCAEQGITVRCVGPLDDTVAMGAQTTLALTDLLQECADADTGMIYEPREALALAYRTRASLQNQAPAVTLGYSQAELADPVGETEDDQYTMNDVTVTRAYASTGGGTGSSAEVAIQTGPLSVQAPPNGVGTYPNSVTQNLFADSQCYDGAGWLAHTGTVDDPRYPQIQVNLARQETLAGSTLGYEVQYADIGDRLTVTGTPDWLPPDGITQLVNGETETLNAFVYDISWCGIPELPYETGTLGDDTYGVDTDGSTLHANATSTATSITVDTTTASPTYLWTVAAADFPFDILVSGERMTVTNITGSSSPQTFTVTRSVNGVVKAQTAGTAVSLFYPAIESL